MCFYTLSALKFRGHNLFKKINNQKENLLVKQIITLFWADLIDDLVFIQNEMEIALKNYVNN